MCTDQPPCLHVSRPWSYACTRYAFNNCPVAELINLSAESDVICPYFGGTVARPNVALGTAWAWRLLRLLRARPAALSGAAISNRE